jgi:ribosomal protein S15P/S13E
MIVVYLYLAGDFDKEMLTERTTRLAAIITALEEERAGLTIQLEAVTLTDEQIATITDFASEVSEGLEIAGQDFDARRKMIDLLEVRVTLAQEDEEKVVYVRCLIDETKLSIAPKSTGSTIRSRYASLRPMPRGTSSSATI